MTGAAFKSPTLQQLDTGVSPKTYSRLPGSFRARKETHNVEI